MSNSYHETYSQLKGLSKIELAALQDDSDSILHKLVEKSTIKRQILSQRKYDNENQLLEEE